MPDFPDDKNYGHLILKDLAALAAVALFCLAVMVWLSALFGPVAP